MRVGVCGIATVSLVSNGVSVQFVQIVTAPREHTISLQNDTNNTLSHNVYTTASHFSVDSIQF